MYIYHALINALSTHMIYINLNTIFYTHIEDSPSSTKTICIRHCMHTHTHICMHILYTHNDCSRNWVPILAGVEILWEEDSFQFGFKIWQGWAVYKVLWEWNPNVGSKARESVLLKVLYIFSQSFIHSYTSM